MASHNIHTNGPATGDWLVYCPPPPDTRSVFRELIATELRAGRLTNARRARIVRYASQMGLSAVEAGRLIAHCAEEASEDANPVVKNYALRLVEAPRRQPLLTPRVAFTTGFLILLIWMLR